MKRLIGLIIVFLLSFTLLFSFEIDALKNVFLNFAPFLESVYGFIDNLFINIKTILNQDFVASLPHWFIDCLIYGVLFIGFTIIYYLFFGIIILIRNASRKRKVEAALNGDVITLSDEEKSKFEWKLYQRKFPFWRLIFVLIELGFFALFIIVRLDKVFTIENAVTYQGITYFPEVVDKFYETNFATLDLYYSIAGRLGSIGEFISNIVAQYIRFMNAIVATTGIRSIEWIIFAVVAIVVLVIFWAIGSIFARPYRRIKAKRRAKRAKSKYIIKLENTELKAYKKSQKENRISEKNRTLYDNEAEGNDFEQNVEPLIADNKVIKEFSDNKKVQTPEQNYIDDISTGVTDLGIIQEDENELQEPLFTRQTHFVGDEEHDIILEEEPIIETIEEEDSYYNDQEEIEEDKFEKYQPEYINSLDLEDKIKKYNIEVIEEEATITPYEEEVEPIMNFDDRQYFTAVNETSSEENVVENPVEINQNNNENSEKKVIKPISLDKDRSKIISYIITTTDTSQLALSSEEKEKIATKKPIKPVSSERRVENVEPIKEEKKVIKPLKPILNKTGLKKPIKPVEVMNKKK